MTKRKEKKLPETIEEVVADLNAVDEEVHELVGEKPKDGLVDDKPEVADTVGSRRAELIKQSEEGEIEKSVAYLKKANEKTINKLYKEFEVKRAARANEFLTDLIISKWADLLGGLNAIENPSELTKELEGDKLLRCDVLNAVSWITPFVPFLGLMSGGITTAKHIYEHKTKISEVVGISNGSLPQ